uniref:Chemokine interleukin-8-like domain-containing protein n=1 Tax=Poecilia mexicana TaxID=48701 RepID=A0A3B3YDX4_9TELE
MQNVSAVYPLVEFNIYSYKTFTELLKSWKKTRILTIKSHYPTGKNRPCCLHVSRKNLSRQVAGSVFYKQPARFPCVNAVIFYTKKGPVFDFNCLNALTKK